MDLSDDISLINVLQHKGRVLSLLGLGPEVGDKLAVLLSDCLHLSRSLLLIFIKLVYCFTESRLILARITERHFSECCLRDLVMGFVENVKIFLEPLPGLLHLVTIISSFCPPGSEQGG